jgi:hypothetical protein
MLLKKLQLPTSIILDEYVEMTSSTAILERIRERAIAKWGEEKWIVGIVRAYVEIAKAQGDEKATTVNRRTQIERVFDKGSCNLETAISLAAAVGCRFQMACTQIEIIDF